MLSGCLKKQLTSFKRDEWDASLHVETEVQSSNVYCMIDHKVKYTVLIDFPFALFCSRYLRLEQLQGRSCHH